MATKYIKLNQREHVLLRPGMYVGSIDTDKVSTWVYKNGMIKREIGLIPGLYKIFDEILTNSLDHANRARDTNNPVRNIKVNIDRSTGSVSVWNDGSGVEVVMHPEHDMYVPELIFGHLLSGSSYNDEEDRTTAGMNGLGCKLTSIFSSSFLLETVDADRKLQYKQLWSNNMSERTDPIISGCAKKSYTSVTFQPDYPRFKMSGLTDDMYDLMMKRSYDACAMTDSNVNVWLNGLKLEFKTFQSYVDLFLGDKAQHARVYEKLNERWEVVATYTETIGFEQMSFCNGIWTSSGGKHVEHICLLICSQLAEMINKRHKGSTVKSIHVRNYLHIFIKATVLNPTFDSQSKDHLTTPVSKFGGVKLEIPVTFIERLYKTKIVEKVLDLLEACDKKSIKKTDGRKSASIRGIPQLEDAKWAGTSNSRDAVLILTEGLSAASMAVSGLTDAAGGRNKYGVFPLRGKILNTLDAPGKRISENTEICNLKKILGLETSRVYSTIDDLRYGSIMLMCDSDVDGSHIKGLIFNLLHSQWPSLIKNNFGFVSTMATPIVKAFQKAQVCSFYNLIEFAEWHTHHKSGWGIKHFKGLGTSTDTEAKEYFRLMKKTTFLHTNQSDEAIDLAFNKKRADNRKDWLSTYVPGRIVDHNAKDITYEAFVHDELIHFSSYDLERSIPSLIDGLKVSQRKILFTCLQRNLVDTEIRVSQLSGATSEISSYHHGEVSLQGAIVNMAQDFIGSNNINLLSPNGQFGTRLHGGSDCAQARYIHTVLTKLAMVIYKKDDTCVLHFLDDEGLSIQPATYFPVIPMILVNQVIGIGTGFSTSIPSYNPMDILSNIRRKLKGGVVEDMVPWARGFKGRTLKIDAKYVSVGNFERCSPSQIVVTELPIGYWTFDFKKDLEAALDRMSDFKKYDNESEGNIVRFTLTFTEEAVDRLLVVEANGFTKFDNDFKLISSRALATTNMHAFNAQGRITKYANTSSMLDEFYETRILVYVQRKLLTLDRMRYACEIMRNKKRFISEVTCGTILVHTLTHLGLCSCLDSSNYVLHQDSFDYITKTSLSSLTIDSVRKLESEINAANLQIHDLEQKTPEDMWMTDLDEFEQAYLLFLSQHTGGS